MISSRRFSKLIFSIINYLPYKLHSLSYCIGTICLLTVFLMCYALPLFSQSYIATLQQYTHEDGLRNHKNHRIYEDSRGFIWVASELGLARFDGHDFTWWTKENNGLRERQVIKILEDSYGFIWLIYFDRLAQKSFVVDLLDPRTGEVAPLEEIEEISVPFQWTNVLDMQAAEDRSLYFLTEGEIFVYESQTGFQSIEIPPFNDPGILQLISENQSVWIGNKTYTEWIKLNSKGKIEDRLSDQANKYLPLYEGQDKSGLWFARINSKGEIKLFKRESSHDLLMDQLESAIQWQDQQEYPLQRLLKFRISDSTVWVRGKEGTEHSFTVHKLGMGQIFQLSTVQASYREFRNIHNFNFDRNGDAWICAHSRLIHLQLKPNKFARFLYSNSGEGMDYSCRGIGKLTDSILWVHTYTGIRQINLVTNRVSEIPQLGLDRLLGSLDVDFPHALSIDRQVYVWVGGYRLLRYRPSDRDIKVYSYNPTYLYDGYNSWIWSILEDRNQNIWLGTANGLTFVEGDSLRKFSQYNDFPSLAKSHVLQIYEDKKANIWVCSSSGLYQLDSEKGITHYWGDLAEDDHKLPFQGVKYIYEDEAGIFWMATFGSGLIRWDRQTREIKRFTTENGLSSNILHSIYEDDYGRLWISSEYGLIQFDKESFQVRNYFEKDGIAHNEFNRISSFQDEDGRLYLGGVNGITSFHPKDFYSKDTTHIPLHITEFKQFNSRINAFEDKTSELIQSGSISMGAENPFFGLSFSLLDYSGDGKKQYSYTIDGLYDNWITQKENHIRLARLPYGNYTLRIRGQSKDGQVSGNELSIPVRVIRPTYLRTDFLALTILSTFIIIVAFYKWRIKGLRRRKLELERMVKTRTESISQKNLQLQIDKETIEKQASELKKLDESKSRFFTNISHELRTPLTLILGPVNTILKNKNLSEKDENLLKTVKLNALHLLRMVNELLNFSSLDANQMTLDERAVSLYPLFENLINAFRPNAALKKIELHASYESDKHLHILLDKDKFSSIFNNLMANALKFTPAEGKIEVKLSESNRNLSLTVSDTGPGIHPDDLSHIFDRFYQSRHQMHALQGGTGIGLSLCKEFSKLMNGTLTVESEVGQGSTFTFIFPLNKALQEGQDQENVGLDDEIEPAVERHPLPAQVVGTRNTTILLVEDNLELRNYIQQILQDQWQILTANNGREAIEIMADPPDHVNIKMVISDIMMPEMDGFGLLEKLKEHPIWNQIPLILLTAKQESNDKLKALRLGVDDYLTKPFAEDELIVRIQNLLKNYRERVLTSEEEKTDESGYTVSQGLQHTRVNKSILNPREQKWMDKFEQIVKENLQDHDFKLEILGEELGISARQLRRRLKKLTGLTPRDYILEIRLQKARSFLENRTLDSVKAVSLSVGFKDVKYFSQKFRERFGRLPSSYLD